jgi:hypothetical protein
MMIDKIGGGDCLLERDKMREARPCSELSRCSVLLMLASGFANEQQSAAVAT